MKLAFLQDVDFERVSFDLGKQFSHLLRGKPLSDRDHEAASKVNAFDAVDDSFSEAINFRFNERGVTYRALVTYDALRDHHGVAGIAEPELALFIRHAHTIGRAARAKRARCPARLVVLESGDL